MAPRKLPSHRQTPRLSSRPIDLGLAPGDQSGGASASSKTDAGIARATLLPSGTGTPAQTGGQQPSTSAQRSGSSSSPLLPSGLPVPDGTERIPPHCFFDLVIIGAGPSALAVLARILETRPAALYTEEEHHFLHWLKKSGGGGRDGAQRGKSGVAQGASSASTPKGLRVIKTKARGSERVIVGEKLLPQAGGDNAGGSTGEGCECPGEMRILVLDKIGDGWLANWNRLFKALQIKREHSAAVPTPWQTPTADPFSPLDIVIADVLQTYGRPSSFTHAPQTSTASWPSPSATAAPRQATPATPFPGRISSRRARTPTPTQRARRARPAGGTRGRSGWAAAPVWASTPSKLAATPRAACRT